MSVRPFVTHLQSTVVSEPRKRPLDNISESSKSAAVHRMPCAWGDQRDDSAGLHLVDDVGRPVSHIRLKDVRAESWPSRGPLNRRNRVEEVDRGKFVVDV